MTEFSVLLQTRNDVAEASSTLRGTVSTLKEGRNAEKQWRVNLLENIEYAQMELENALNSLNIWLAYLREEDQHE